VGATWRAVVVGLSEVAPSIRGVGVCGHTGEDAACAVAVASPAGRLPPVTAVGSIDVAGDSAPSLVPLARGGMAISSLTAPGRPASASSKK